MFLHLFKKPKPKPNGDTVCLVAKDGSMSNGALHEILMSEVDDDAQAKAAAQFLNDGDSEKVRKLFS